MPGYAFRTRGVAKNSPWIARGIVTAQSLSCMIEMVNAQHLLVKDPSKRRKLTRGMLEEKAEMCALACAFSSLVFGLL